MQMQQHNITNHWLPLQQIQKIQNYTYDMVSHVHGWLTDNSVIRTFKTAIGLGLQHSTHRSLGACWKQLLTHQPYVYNSDHKDL